MTAHDLIRQLRTLPPETEVFVWLDEGSRLPVVEVDDDPAFVARGYADLMVKED